MKIIRSLEDLNQFREEIIEKKQREADSGKTRITLGLGTCGIAAGALAVLRVIQEHVASGQLKDVTVSQTGCIGLCRHEPILEISIPGAENVTYGSVTAEAAERIIHEHILGGRVLEEFVINTAPFPTI